MYFSIEQKNRAFTVFHNASWLSSEPHLHSHIEFVFLHEGESLAYADGKSSNLKKGDLFIAFPNQIHYYEHVCRPISADIFIISAATCPEFKNFFKTRLPNQPVIKNALSNPSISNSLEILLNNHKKNDELSEWTMRGATLVLLSECLRLCSPKESKSKGSSYTKDILNFCYENYMSDISLQSIADELHISRYYISHLFSKRLNVSFNDYVNTLRVRKACELLKADDASITEISHTVGYNSVRTFNRCFQKVRGITPREYRTLKRKAEG